MVKKQAYPKGNMTVGVITVILIIVVVIGAFIYTKQAQAPVDSSMTNDNDVMQNEDVIMIEGDVMNGAAGTMEEGSIIPDDNLMVGGDAMIDTSTIEVEE
jgi:hypothetical protein